MGGDTGEMATGRGHLHQVTLGAIRGLFIYQRQNSKWSTPSAPCNIPRLFPISIKELFQESEKVYEHIRILLLKKSLQVRGSQDTHPRHTHFFRGSAVPPALLNTFQALQKCGLYVVSISVCTLGMTLRNCPAAEATEIFRGRREPTKFLAQFHAQFV